MERQAMGKLCEWKNAATRKPLIVNGARQVGKTWLVKEFGRRYFEHTAHVVFLNNEEVQRIFDGSLEPNRLLALIGAVTGTNPLDGKTLVFLDEIQECPRAITALKLFCEQRPDVPIIAAGSLLGVALSRNANSKVPVSWPVGKVSYLDLSPLSFSEYVQAVDAPLFKLLSSGDFELIDSLQERFTDLLRTYLFVGGMPEVVQRYIDTGDYVQVRSVQTELLSGYELDFPKHVLSALEVEHIRQTWKSVPTQLARESDMRRFVYASIRDGARGRDYRDSVTWLVDAGLVTKVRRVSKPGMPLAGYEDETYFKLYLLDVGLLGAATGLGAKVLAEGNRLFTEYKGVYAEQFVCQQLTAMGMTPRYWSADGKQKKGEIDFLVETEDGVVPLEVKADENVAGGSLSAFVKQYDLARAVRLSMLPFKEQDWLVNIPLYGISLLANYL